MPATLTIEVSDELLARLRERAAEAGKTPEQVAAADLARVQPKSATDPFMKLAGMFTSGVPDAAERHDQYLGEALAEELRGGTGS
jgi:hypothetical protein